MSGLDLDTLRGRWAEQGRRIDDSLVLDVAAVRATLAHDTTSAFSRHRRWVLLATVAVGAAVTALAVFIGGHWGQWDWVALAALLLPLLLAELVVDLREWRALRRLDLDAPVMQVREALHGLRWRRLRLARGYLLFSVLLWWPFLLVCFKGLFGVDLLRWLPPSVLLANLAVGLGWIPVAMAVAVWATRQYGHSPGWQRFLDDVAGRSWRRASDEFEARGQFELAVEDGSVEREPAQYLVPDAIRRALGPLRRRLLAGILASATGVLLAGAFNASHGGEPRYLVSGLLLLWALLAQMVPQILHRSALAPAGGGATALRERLEGMLGMRRRMASATLVAAPLLVLPLAIVIARLVVGIDLVQRLAPVGQGLAVSLALLASAVLAWRWRRNPSGFAPRAVEAICLGTLSRTRALVERLQREARR